jgi:hypothetical protein
LLKQLLREWRFMIARPIQLLFVFIAAIFYAAESRATTVYFQIGGLRYALAKQNLDQQPWDPFVIAYGLDAAQRGIAIDTLNNKILVATATIEGWPYALRFNLDGSGMEQILPGVELFGIDVDDVHRKLYWAESRSGRIQRSNLDGSGVETAVIVPISPGGPFPENPLVDPLNQKVYWTTRDAAGAGIHRSNLDGTEIETIFTAPAIDQFGIDIDPVEQKLYWTRSTSFSSPGVIERSNLDGSQVETVLNCCFDDSPSMIQIDPIARKMYFWDGINLFRGNLDATELEFLFETGRFALDVRPVPEPATLGLAAMGSLVLLFWQLRRRTTLERRLTPPQPLRARARALLARPGRPGGRGFGRGCTPTTHATRRCMSMHPTVVAPHPSPLPAGEGEQYARWPISPVDPSRGFGTIRRNARAPLAKSRLPRDAIENLAADGITKTRKNESTKDNRHLLSVSSFRPFGLS